MNAPRERCCNQNCAQGRKCPVREACHLPVDDGHDDAGIWLGMSFGEFLRDVLIPGAGSVALLLSIIWLICEIALLHNTGKLTP